MEKNTAELLLENLIGLQARTRLSSSSLRMLHIMPPKFMLNILLVTVKYIMYRSE